jgi:undecaprenyl pyrophosphate synthase
MFDNVWNENDEISILKASLEYAENKRRNLVSASDDMTQFYNIFKQLFHRNTMRLQLVDKVWRLKKKFKNNIAKKSEKK